MSWSVTDIPSQQGRTAIVTGPSVGGLGQYTALELANACAHVVLAGRNPAKLGAAREAILAVVPSASLSTLDLDVSSLSSVRAAAEAAEDLGPVHLLINNAGVMGSPYSRTADHLELQLATNHLGPFLLTGLLLPQLIASGDARVVAVASNAHKIARSAPLGDPLVKHGRYSRWLTYGQTKLANLLFTYELDRRLREADLPVQAMAAHPGYAGTHLTANGQFGRSAGGLATILDAANRAIGQSPAAGAWPTLMAATADLPGATYCGPSGMGEMAGTPQVTTSNQLSYDRSAQAALWELSEKTTGISYL